MLPVRMTVSIRREWALGDGDGDEWALGDGDGVYDDDDGGGTCRLK